MPDSLKHKPALPLNPGQWLGLMGGGQLGRMFCSAAQSLGFRVVVLDPSADGPAASVADDHIATDYSDHAGLTQLAARAGSVTTEFENVPAAAMAQLAQHCTVSPAAECVEVAQDRMREKAFIKGAGLQPAPYCEVHQAADLHNALDDLFPGILKAARLGYDGKGQARVQTKQQALEAFAQMGNVPCVLERMLPLDFEISVICARGFDGNIVTYPVAQNEHRDGILAISSVPSPTATAELQTQARAAAQVLIDQLNYFGVLCVEFFVLKDGSLIVNEMAPRPHNSGHYSIDACVTSQFEQQVRVMAGLPLGSTYQHETAVMINLLGDIWFDAQDQLREPNWAAVLAQPRAKLHLYGKTQARKARKMGHITCLGNTLEDARHTAAAVCKILGIEFA